MIRIALLDDYQSVALDCADWGQLSAGCMVKTFHDHLKSEDALAARLKDFDIVVALRERTPFPRSLLEKLPNLRLLVSTGMKNASIDFKAATDLEIPVCGTSTILSHPSFGYRANVIGLSSKNNSSAVGSIGLPIPVRFNSP